MRHGLSPRSTFPYKSQPQTHERIGTGSGPPEADGPERGRARPGGATAPRIPERGKAQGSLGRRQTNSGARQRTRAATARIVREENSSPEAAANVLDRLSPKNNVGDKIWIEFSLSGTADPPTKIIGADASRNGRWVKTGRTTPPKPRGQEQHCEGTNPMSAAGPQRSVPAGPRNFGNG